jgi:hypothetical protein
VQVACANGVARAFEKSAGAASGRLLDGGFGRRWAFAFSLLPPSRSSVQRSVAVRSSRR